MQADDVKQGHNAKLGRDGLAYVHKDKLQVYYNILYLRTQMMALYTSKAGIIPFISKIDAHTQQYHKSEDEESETSRKYDNKEFTASQTSDMVRALSCRACYFLSATFGNPECERIVSLINQMATLDGFQKSIESPTLLNIPRPAGPMKMLCDIITLAFVQCCGQAEFDKMKIKSRFYLTQMINAQND